MSIRKKIKRLLKMKYSYSREELISWGARCGKNFYNCGTIDRGHIFLLTIGDDVTLSDCQILCHDASTKRALGYARVGRVEIGNNVFIGADAIVLPNVKIGSNVIIGAGSVVCKDIPDNCVAAGNPCRPIKSYEEFVRENKELLKTAPVFETPSGQKSEEEKKKEYEALKNGGIGFDY